MISCVIKEHIGIKQPIIEINKNVNVKLSYVCITKGTIKLFYKIRSHIIVDRPAGVKVQIHLILYCKKKFSNYFLFCFVQLRLPWLW